ILAYMETIPITEAKARIAELADRVAREHDHFTITRNGRADVMLISVAEYEPNWNSADALARSERNRPWGRPSLRSAPVSIRHRRDAYRAYTCACPRSGSLPLLAGVLERAPAVPAVYFDQGAEAAAVAFWVRATGVLAGDAVD